MGVMSSRWPWLAVLAAVVLALAVLLGFAMGVIPEAFQGGCLPLIPALVVACMVLGVDQLMARWSSSGLRA